MTLVPKSSSNLSVSHHFEAYEYLRDYRDFKLKKDEAAKNGWHDRRHDEESGS